MLFLALAAPALCVLAMIVYNVSVWPRGRPDGRMPGRLSVLIPARNEAATIEQCIRAALAGTRLPDEVLVYDDASTDATAEIVAGLTLQHSAVKLLRGDRLPDGWLGKPHACHHLAQAASGDVLMFLDADTTLHPTGIARVASLFEDFQAEAVTAGLQQRLGTWSERLIIPLLHLTYVAWLPVPLVWRTRDRRFLIANGQLFAVSRNAYQRAGGWAPVRDQVIDDMAFGRLLKQTGARLVFADGSCIASCRMYGTADEIIRGFSKNLYEGIGGTVGALAGVICLYTWAFLVPYLALAGALAFGWPAVLRPALLGVAANTALRTVLALRFRQPPEGILLHPLAVLALLGISVNSFRWSRQRRIEWRGRVYAPRAAR